MQNKKVSVICATNRSDPFFYAMVDSVKRQTYKNIELIIVLDGVLILDSAVAGENVVILKNDEPLGITVSLNRAIEASSGDYIARVDSLDICFPDRIARQVQYLEEKGLDLVSCYVSKVNELGEPKETVRPPLTHKAIASCLERANPMVHSSILATREALYKVGLYDGNVRYAQDYDLYLKLILAGSKFGVIPEVLMSKRISRHSTTINRRRLQLRYAIAAQKRYFSKVRHNPLYVFYCIALNRIRYAIPISVRNIRYALWNR